MEANEAKKTNRYYVFESDAICLDRIASKKQFEKRIKLIPYISSYGIITLKKPVYACRIVLTIPADRIIEANKELNRLIPYASNKLNIGMEYPCFYSTYESNKIDYSIGAVKSYCLSSIREKLRESILIEQFYSRHKICDIQFVGLNIVNVFNRRNIAQLDQQQKRDLTANPDYRLFKKQYDSNDIRRESHKKIVNDYHEKHKAKINAKKRQEYRKKRLLRGLKYNRRVNYKRLK